MDMIGERRIPAPRQQVWDALNDTEVLRACIPGCETLEKTSESDLKATASIKIGPISARFAGKVQLLDLDPPNSYRIAGEGQGGVAGFAKGGADVRLADDGDGTLLTYVVKAQVGGKIAQLGARLIDATSKQMADMFFDRFTAAVAGPAAAVASAAIAASSAGPTAGSPVSPQVIADPSLPTPSPALIPGLVPAPLHDGPTPRREAAELAPPLHKVSKVPGISIFDMIPKEPFGFPRIAFVGTALFIVIFIMIFKTYVTG